RVAEPRSRNGWRWVVLTTGVLLLLLASLLRLYGFEETFLAWDQSYLIANAIETARFHPPPAGIKSSVGVYQTAVISYLAAIPWILVPRVIAIKWFFSVLDLIAIAVLYRAVRIVFGYRAAVLSTLLYVINPWVVEFVRWIWYQALTPTWAAMGFSFLLLAITRKRGAGLYLALGLISATFMGTVHIAGAPWAVVLFLGGLLLAWRRRAWAGWGAGMVGSFLIVLPYILFILREVPGDLSQALKMGTQGSGWNLAVFPLTLELISGRGVYSMPVSPVWINSLIQIPAAMHWMDYVVGVALVGSLFCLVFSKDHRPALLFTLGWTLGAPLMYLRSSVYLVAFYLLYVFPAPFVLMGATISLARRFPYRILQVAGGIIGVLITGWVVVVSLVWAQAWSTRIRLEQEWRMGPSTRAWLLDQTAEQIGRYLNQHPDCEVIIISSFVGDGSAFDWIRSALRTDRVRIVQAGNGLIVAPRCTCYLLAPDSTEADLSPIRERLVEELQLTIAAISPWKAYCLTDRGDMPAPLAEWENGLSLVGVRIDGEPQANGQVRVEYTWHYREVAPGYYHFFNHLFCGDQTLVAQMDGPGVPPPYWRDDDVLVTRFELRLPASIESGNCRLLMGIYRWPDLQRAVMKDGKDIYEVYRWTIS
ncbi:MAG: hypothetical protein ACPLYD_16045, partial [Anaerolineae bacterium]